VVCLFRVDAKEMALAAKRAPAKGANGLGVWLETVFVSRRRISMFVVVVEELRQESRMHNPSQIEVSISRTLIDRA
jgi:hypothetical protein